MAHASRPELSLIDGSWDTPAQPTRRPSSRMSVIDRSWSEPGGVPVVAPAMLATGTAAHAAHAITGPENAEPQRFLGIPVASPRITSRAVAAVAAAAAAAAAAGRPNHDATTLVNPLPTPPRPGAHDRSAPRAAVIPDEHAARSRQRRFDRRRRRIAILVGAVAGVALACGVMVLSSKEPDRQAAAQQPQQQLSPQPRAVVPAAAPAAPAKPQHARTAALAKTAAAPAKTAAAPAKTAAAPKRTATAPAKVAAAPKKAAAAPKRTATAPAKTAVAPKKTAAAPKKTAAAPTKTAAKKPAKPAALPATKKPAGR